MNDPTHEIEIRFEDMSLAAASTKAEKLRKELERVSPDTIIRVAKDDLSNQDFGSTLVLLLGTPAILAVAHGIASYLQRDRGTVAISANGIVAEGISGNDVARIVEALAMRKK